MYVNMYVYMYVNMSVNMYVKLYVNMYETMFVNMNVNMYVNMCETMCVNIYVNMYVNLYWMILTVCVHHHSDRPAADISLCSFESRSELVGLNVAIQQLNLNFFTWKWQLKHLWLFPTTFNHHQLDPCHFFPTFSPAII